MARWQVPKAPMLWCFVHSGVPPGTEEPCIYQARAKPHILWGLFYHAMMDLLFQIYPQGYSFPSPELLKPFIITGVAFLGGMGPSSSIPSLIGFKLPTPHQPHYQIPSVHYDSSIAVSSEASLSTPGVQWEQLVGTLFELDLNYHQIDHPIKTTPTHGKWGIHWYPG